MTDLLKQTWCRWLALAALILMLIIGAYYWVESRHSVSTSDAYIQTSVSHIAPQVTGQVDQVNVSEHEHVKKGQLLFTMDQTRFKDALQQAKAQLDADQARFQNASRIAKRRQRLVQKRAVSKQACDDALTKQRQLKATLKADRARLHQAQWDLDHTNVHASTSGWISQLSLEPGDSVQAYHDVFVLISDHDFWLKVNLKETKLRAVKPGQCALITTDTYPNHPFHGRVQSISHASGNRFALLPSENPTGNWVKVTQRVPVRVKILDADPNHPLRIGTSATTTLHLDQNCS